MNSLRSSCLLFYSSMLLVLTSCGGTTEQNSNTDTTKTDTTAVTAPPQANTTITTPQNMVIVTHKVSNFVKWKASYEEHDSTRLANGIHSYVIGRGMQDSNIVLVALKADDAAKAKAFVKDPSLKTAMQKGGVVSKPSISFVTMTFQDTANINSDLRSQTMFTIKDWDAWQKAFEDGKQERQDNGITVRAYGHEADNNHKVILVTAITDTAKAFAFYKSDMLKKRRQESGVMGEPVRFMFHIVQRY